ncbi:hypothetical protein H5410_054714 [Solanum commersonii]|uniref:Uncharacterized protein n=1 Tax=Solanum commersonii TaxID=4109 RepID=A0A9J5WH76_SOLCO|nr:hypothetical protein H5410_054714 [Solanum commersonii]
MKWLFKMYSPVKSHLPGPGGDRRCYDFPTPVGKAYAPWADMGGGFNPDTAVREPRALILSSYRPHPAPLDLARKQNSSLPLLHFTKAPGKSNRKVLISGWAYYIDTFNSLSASRLDYPRYRGMLIGTLRGATFPILSLRERSSQRLTPTSDMDRTRLTTPNPAHIPLNGQMPQPLEHTIAQAAKSQHRVPNLPADAEARGRSTSLSLE